MSRVPYTNTSKAGHYIGNVFVPAGGTRTVDGRLLAPVTTSPPAAVEDPMKQLAAGPVAGIVAALPTLDAAACEALLGFERENKKRPTAIEAIELRKLEILDAEEQARKAAEAEEAASAAGADGSGAGGGQGAGGE